MEWHPSQISSAPLPQGSTPSFPWPFATPAANAPATALHPGCGQPPHCLPAATSAQHRHPSGRQVQPPPHPYSSQERNRRSLFWGGGFCEVELSLLHSTQGGEDALNSLNAWLDWVLHWMGAPQSTGLCTQKHHRKATWGCLLWAGDLGGGGKEGLWLSALEGALLGMQKGPASIPGTSSSKDQSGGEAWFPNRCVFSEAKGLIKASCILLS